VRRVGLERRNLPVVRPLLEIAEGRRPRAGGRVDDLEREEREHDHNEDRKESALEKSVHCAFACFPRGWCVGISPAIMPGDPGLNLTTGVSPARYRHARAGSV